MMKLKILRWGHYPGLSGWVLNPATNVPIREGQRDHTRRREGYVKRTQGLEWWPQAENATAARSWERQGTDSFQGLRRERGLANTCILPTEMNVNVWLPDGERLHFCCKAASVWQSVMTATGNEHTTCWIQAESCCCVLLSLAGIRMSGDNTPNLSLKLPSPSPCVILSIRKKLGCSH